MQNFKVLFLCTGNSARSIMAEAILGHLGAGRFSAASAGSSPTGQINEAAVRQLAEKGLATGHYRSKSWLEFASPDAEPFDLVVTVCDNAAGESCPVWPGQPLTVHWGIDDPAAVDGSPEQIGAAFASAYEKLSARIERLVELPVESLRKSELHRELQVIGNKSIG